MTKRVSNKRGTNVGARSYQTSIRGREKAYQARQREAAESARLNPKGPQTAPEAARKGCWGRMRDWVHRKLRRRSAFA